jgi:hypothetical protein
MEEDRIKRASRHFTMVVDYPGLREERIKCIMNEGFTKEEAEHAWNAVNEKKVVPGYEWECAEEIMREAFNIMKEEFKE